jgi:hypothetical protein
MRILIGWDQPEEAELISLYLSASGNDVRTFTDRAQFRDEATAGGEWDVV